ncbi:ABC transporter permease [Nakamurella endophytica]|uniref:Oligopeptide transport system permease protein OppC n=1 Tax=Nakamurella endophytica TaxID=1748367 RepID=A0A917SMR0_9ACTN|nr:ABC transporter permease [Nakamurella endophytica]GGL86477.1 ABC transporter permease [Nakamurella endophytica]
MTTTRTGTGADPQQSGPPAPPEETGSLEQKEVAGLSQGQIVRKRFLRHKGAMISLVVLILVILLAATSIGWGPIPGWYHWKYTDLPDPYNPQGEPTMSVPGLFGGHGWAWGIHPFGQDETGLDLFAAVMRGTQQTIVVILILGLLSTVIGVVIGAVAGYYRGWVDAVLMRFTDLIITLPIILITAVLGFVLNAHGIWSVALALGLLSWTTLARLVRGEFLALREREFVDAARVAGASDRRIIFKHILPNTVGIIAVNTTLLMGAGILSEAALSFLGFGIRLPDLSLGSLISAYAQSFSFRPWLFVWPGIFIIIIVLCINFIGDGLRDAFDPKQKRIPKARALRADRATSAKAELSTHETAAPPSPAVGL